MKFLRRLVGLERGLMGLLAVKIVADEDHRYFVSFRPLHPELKEPEYIRLMMHYYAKMLFNFDTASPDGRQAATILRGMMDAVLQGGLAPDAGVLEVAEIDDVVSIVSTSPRNRPREIAATLYFVDTIRRHIVTEFPQDTYLQHLAFSVMVLLQATLRQVGHDSIEVLQRALANMNAAYDSGQSYSSLENLVTVPASAFMDALTSG